jgi:hypothetical protein
LFTTMKALIMARVVRWSVVVAGGASVSRVTQSSERLWQR